MSEFSEYAYSADTLDSAKSCSCSHCRSEGRYEQDSSCIWYSQPVSEPLTVVNRARRNVA